MPLNQREAIVAALNTRYEIRRLAQGRIYHQQMPQEKQYPAIVYRQSGGNRVKSLAGDTGLAFANFQLGFLARDSRDAAAMSDALNELIGAAVIAGYRWIWREDETDELDFPPFNDEKGIQEIDAEIRVAY